jgi:hypothetical protein
MTDHMTTADIYAWLEVTNLFINTRFSSGTDPILIKYFFIN